MSSRPPEGSAVFRWKGNVKTVKRNYVAVVLAGIMLLAMSAQAGASSVLPMFKDQENDTVTISREEYDRLMQYSKLDTLMQLVEAYYYEDADTDAML